MNHRAKPSPRFDRPFAAFAAAMTLALTACNTAPTAEPVGEPPLAGADIGGDFELIDSAGETVRWADFDGRYRIVYFGYAFCPDICPTDVQRMTQGLKQFGEASPDAAKKITPIFITVDPERDTPEVVGEFADAFSDDLVGLTGTREQVDAAAGAFRIAHSRGQELDNGAYLVNHSNYTYLFSPDGEPITTLPTDLGADAVAEELAKWVK